MKFVATIFLMLASFGPVAAAAPPVTLDGDLGEWPPRTNAIADSHHIYLRLDLPEPVTLQASTIEHQIHLDIDIDSDTTNPHPGTNLTISFSGGKRRQGASVTVHGADGNQTTHSHAVVGLAAPTYAAKSFEVRISRRALARLADQANLRVSSVITGSLAIRGLAHTRELARFSLDDLP
ncbi:MAG: hypothetical protein CMJ18_15275 [Phycisphaeraceae bacterium]|nr:hypothetical protein [Phycisphaeraceae bacterium]